MPFPSTGEPFHTNLLPNEMDIISSIFYVVDNKLYNSNNINFQFNSSSYLTYEVMRCTRGVLVFLDDHIKRMESGIEILGREIQFSRDLAIENLNRLMISNDNFEGNVKLLCGIDKQKLLFAAYGIQHNYPKPELYKEGILLRTVLAVRSNPIIKQVHIADSITRKIGYNRAKSVYESLLVNNEDCITEGSKSNFFLILDNSLFSAPMEDILNGITRKYVLQIAAHKNIEVIHKKISINELDKYEAAFICGTSPKILPVRKINNVNYNPAHPILKVLIESFDLLFKAHMNDL